MNADEFSRHVYVLLIGVDRVDSCALPTLTSPSGDVERLKNALLKSDGCGVPTDHIKVLTGTDANKKNCIEIIEELARKVSFEDVLFIYFSGHGLRDDSDFYLCTSDANETDLISSALSATELDMLFQPLRARGVLLLLDCCRSAGFAELAPSFFRHLGDKDFKILLSASRANELSWELPAGHGTLFSTYLSGIIDGSRQTGETPGLIYFSELLNDIQQQLREDFEAKTHHLPLQEPVFTGTYAMDPLLLVHKGLTLQQIRVKTKRYSKAYIRRLAARAIGWTVATLVVVSAFAYSMLENFQFVVIENKKPVAYIGLPGVQIFGFPKKAWVYDISVTDIDQWSPLLHHQALVSKLGGTTDDILFATLRPVPKAVWEMELGHLAIGGKLLRDALNQSTVWMTEELTGLEWLTIMGQPSDTAIFKKRLGYADVNIRATAISGLLRYCPAEGIALAETDHSLRSGGLFVASAFTNIVVSNLRDEGLAAQQFREYIMSLPYNFTRRLALENAYLQRSPLSDAGWIKLLSSLGGDDWGEDLAHFFQLTDEAQQQRLTAWMADRLATSTNQIEQKYLLQLLGERRYPLSKPQLIVWMNNAYPATAFYALRLYVSLYGTTTLNQQLLQRLRVNSLCIPLLYDYHLLSASDLLASFNKANTIEQAQILLGLKALPKNLIDPIYPSLIPLMENNATYFDVRQKALELVAFFGYQDFYFTPFLNAGGAGLRATAWDYYAHVQPETAVTAILSEITTQDSDVVAQVLTHNKMTANDIERLRETIQKNDPAPNAALKAMAAQGPLDDLQSLFNNADDKTRWMAAEYAAANPNMGMLLKVTDYPGYHNKALYYAMAQYRLKVQYIRQLQFAPQNLRNWQFLQQRNSQDFYCGPGKRTSYGVTFGVEKTFQFQ